MPDIEKLKTAVLNTALDLTVAQNKLRNLNSALISCEYAEAGDPNGAPPIPACYREWFETHGDCDTEAMCEPCQQRVKQYPDYKSAIRERNNAKKRLIYAGRQLLDAYQEISERETREDSDRPY